MGLFGAQNDRIGRGSKAHSPVGQSSYWEMDIVDSLFSLQTYGVNVKKSGRYFCPKTSLGMYMEVAYPWP